MRKFLSVVFLLLTQALFAQEQLTSPWMIYAQDSLHQFGKSTPLQKKTQDFLLQSKTPLSKRKLRNNGVRIRRMLDSFNAIVSLSKSNLKGHFKQTTLIPANNLWKLADVLLNAHHQEGQYVLRSTDVASTRVVLKKLPGVQIVQQHKNDLYIKGNLATFKSAALSLPEVQYLGIESLEPAQESIVRDLNPAINNINTIYKAYPELDGSGVFISVKDNKFRENDIDLLAKLITSPLGAEATDDHATDMATIIAGLGNSSIKGRGVAPKAQLQTSDFLNLTPDSVSFLSDTDIYLQNHSYGTIRESFYGTLAASYDEHIAQNPNELHIFSAGNAGEETPTEGAYANLGDYANLTGNFKMAKNTLIVGATDEEKRLSPFSSRGPAYDGRIKPELVGYSITGTSNSTALTTGVAGLLQQRYKEQFGSNAAAALLKAALINSADDIGTPGPDHRSGYGVLNGYKALTVLTGERFINGTIGDSETTSFSISIPPNSKNFKATIVWTDLPAAVNSNSALVNDIDLRISDAQNTTYLPWVLGTQASLISLEQPAVPGADHLNNVEQIFIESPPEGIAQLQVTGFDISGTSQEFYIAYGWEEANTFVWNYPLANDNFPYDGETASYFRWESNFEQQEGEMAISYDAGQTWETIAPTVDLPNGYYLWPPPENVTGTAMLRMVIGTETFESDSFIISDATAVNVALDCEETVELSWNPQKNVKNYGIYNLRENQMELTAMTTDTTYAFTKSDVASSYFAIEPIFETTEIGIRSETIDYEFFDAGCYESFLLANLSEDKQGGLLSIFLSSILNVSRVAIEKKIGDTYATIGQVDLPNTLTPTFLDAKPAQGLNRYRVTVVLEDGTTYTSEEADLLFLTTTPFITLPNPIDNGVTVFTSDFDNQTAWFELYSLDGKIVFRKEITDKQEFVLLDGLQQGVYLLRLYSTAGSKMSKLVYKR